MQTIRNNSNDQRDHWRPQHFEIISNGHSLLTDLGRLTTSRMPTQQRLFHSQPAKQSHILMTQKFDQFRIAATNL